MVLVINIINLNWISLQVITRTDCHYIKIWIKSSFYCFWPKTDPIAELFVLQGYAVNPRKNDVTTFNFNYNDPNVSEQFVRNYLWDVIATGVKPVWDSV